MIAADIRQLVPNFILNDRTGYAMAKAIEKGMEMLCQTIQDGIDTVIDVTKMPEWRLDELAWELDALYDYDAEVENKREWISNAESLYESYGTPDAIYNFLSGYFDEVELEESWQYGGDPYHFRVTVNGSWDASKEAWAARAIAVTKNVRSVLDDLSIGSNADIVITGETDWSRAVFGATGTYRSGENAAFVTDGAMATAADDNSGEFSPNRASGNTPGGGTD